MDLGCISMALGEDYGGNGIATLSFFGSGLLSSSMYESQVLHHHLQAHPNQNTFCFSFSTQAQITVQTGVGKCFAEWTGGSLFSSQ